MQKINSDAELENLLKETVSSSGKKSFKIFAGHLPMIYRDRGEYNRTVKAEPDRWGAFSTYTFQAGARLLNYVLNEGFEGKILVLVDDLAELPEKMVNGHAVKEKIHWMDRRRRYFYNNDSFLPYSYNKALQEYNLDESFLIPQIRDSEHESILISEKMTRAAANEKKLISPNECSQSYKGLLYDEHFFNFEDDYLISFVPGQCKGNICDGFLEGQTRLNALHVFFPHMEDMGGLMQTKTGYIKIRNSMTIDEIFRSGVFFRQDKSREN